MEMIRFQALALGMAAALLLAGCTGPGGAPYDCTVLAVRAQAELPPGRWSRLLMAQYHDVTMGHTYMVFDSPDGHLFAYDSVFGSRPIFPRSREAKDVAAAVDPRAETAWFVEDTPERKPLGTSFVEHKEQPSPRRERRSSVGLANPPNGGTRPARIRRSLFARRRVAGTAHAGFGG